jgi:RNA polymerase sigma factor (sigma-70 family)
LLDEQLLVKRCLQGHAPSQKELYNLFSSKMLGVCYRYANSTQEAEDFLQDAMITVFRKLDQFRNEGGVERWMYRVTVNACINGIRARRRHTEQLDSTAAQNMPVASQTEPGVYNELIEMVRQLPEGARTVFNLHAVEGYPHVEIAKLLDVNVNTVRSRYSQARELLMKKIGSEPPKK